jgi:hypothetical protein
MPLNNINICSAIPVLYLSCFLLAAIMLKVFPCLWDKSSLLNPGEILLVYKIFA